MPTKILFKYTSRSRVNNFFRGLDSIIDNLSNKEDYYVLCSFDGDDSEYKNEMFINRLMEYKNVGYHFGISTGKVNAINRDLPLAPSFDILVNFSDDQVFLSKGFDDIIRNDMPKDLDYFLHYLDGTPAKDILCTMSIMGKKYFERTNNIYNPEYVSVYCDNEATEVAKRLGKYKFMDLQLYCHFHPAWGTEKTDYLYQRNENKELYHADHQTFLRRQSNNFDL